MPVTINELVFTAVNTDRVAQKSSPSAEGKTQNRSNTKEIIEECVEEVLRILEQKKER